MTIDEPTAPRILVSFDIDGTMEFGDPPGPVSAEVARELVGLMWSIDRVLHDLAPGRIEETAQAAGISEEETRRVLKISRHPISLDRPVGESEDSFFGEFIEDDSAESPVAAATEEMLKDKIDHVLKTLTYREREIIKLRYGLGDGYTYTLEEVGRIFKVTRERVRQIEAKAVRKLQHPVRSRQLEGFLDSLRH